MNETDTEFERYKLALAQNGRRVSMLIAEEYFELVDGGHTSGNRYRQVPVIFMFKPDGSLRFVSNPIRAWWRLKRVVPLWTLVRRR